MNFIRKNKFVIIAIGIFLILVFVIFQIANIFFPEGGEALYGDRLDGIEEVEIDKDKQKDIESALESNESVKKTSVSISGKIIEVIITANDDTTLDAAKALAPKVVEELSKDELDFYDIQVFVKKDTDAADFPIIGYKHHAKDDFSWTKDRGAE